MISSTSMSDRGVTLMSQDRIVVEAVAEGKTFFLHLLDGPR